MTATETDMTGDTDTAKTDGQVAYETFYGPFGPPAPWDEAYGDAREQWEATAGAVAAPLRERLAEVRAERSDVAAQLNDARARIAELERERTRMLSLAAEWDASAIEAERHRDETDSEEHDKWVIRAALCRSHAARLRARAGLDA